MDTDKIETRIEQLWKAGERICESNAMEHWEATGEDIDWEDQLSDACTRIACREAGCTVEEFYAELNA